jgi:hypothetical protein
VNFIKVNTPYKTETSMDIKARKSKEYLLTRNVPKYPNRKPTRPPLTVEDRTKSPSPIQCFHLLKHGAPLTRGVSAYTAFRPQGELRAAIPVKNAKNR